MSKRATCSRKRQQRWKKTFHFFLFDEAKPQRMSNKYNPEIKPLRITSQKNHKKAAPESTFWR